MSHQMTEIEATNEAVLLFTRKMRRMHPEAFADIWKKIPDGAKEAIFYAERQADQLRDANPDGVSYPVEPDLEFEGE